MGYSCGSGGYGSSCGGYSAGGQAYNSLESMVSYASSGSSYSTQNYSGSVSHSIESTPKEEFDLNSIIPKEGYKSKEKDKFYQNMKYEKGIFVPDNMLLENRPATQFIGDAKDIMDYVRKTFEIMTGNPFPNDLTVTVCDAEELKKSHKSFSDEEWSNGILGFAINRKPDQASQIFVRKDNLDRLMLTLGHEIGHVMSETLPDQRDEEAKAFAFSMAWAKIISENNIAGLSRCISPRPAENGIHDVADEFVSRLLKSGKSAFEIYLGLVSGKIAIAQAE